MPLDQARAPVWVWVPAKAPDATAEVSPRPAAVIAAATTAVRLRWVRPDGPDPSCGGSGAVSVMLGFLRNFIFFPLLFL